MIRVLTLAAIAALTTAGAALAATNGFRLAALDGARWVDSRDFAGRTTVLIGWADWCPPCVAETPNLATLAARHPDLALVVAAIAPDQRARGRLKVLNGTLVRLAQAPTDSVGWMRRLGNPTAALPYAAAFDASGRLCAAASGVLDDAALDALRRGCAPTPSYQGGLP